MKSTWYCNDCESQIDEEQIDEHESKGHEVRGMLQPDRLIGNDPWSIGEESESEDEVSH